MNRNDLLTHTAPAVITSASESRVPSPFRYYPGQFDYLARVGVKESALIAADVGTGKSLMAVSLIRLKLEEVSADGQRRLQGRAIIVAPGGTLRASEDEDDDDSESGVPASQWRQEIARFAPGVRVIELFRWEDYFDALQPDGSLPDGIYVTYFEAFFRNGARQSLPESWKDPHKRVCEEYNGGNLGPMLHKYFLCNPGRNRKWWVSEGELLRMFPSLAPAPGESVRQSIDRQFPKGQGSLDHAHQLEMVSSQPVYDYSEGVGTEKRGIRCVLSPCLAERIEAHQHLCRLNSALSAGELPPVPQRVWDMVCVDEAHVCTNLGAQVTQSLIRVQARFRFAFTATPIPNIVSNLFALMGWLCVPEWYLGEKRNAAWPYARGDAYRFDRTFLSYEMNLTEGAKRNKRPVPKASPVLASPARLLKLLKPTMAFISKEACNPEYRGPNIIDVRVRLGQEQARLYAFCLNRRNIPAANGLVRARKQIQWLRAACADPAGFKFKGPKASSNFNPKTLAILELIREILTRGEQVLVISARIGQTDTLQGLLRQAGIESVRIDSTMPPERHQAEAARFKAREVPVCFMGIKCAASHSFAQCENEIVGSLEWSYGAKHQAFGRVDRVNSRPGVRIYCVLHRDTIEEAMFDRVAMKQDAATICLRGQRVPREYAPVEASEVLAANFVQWEKAGALEDEGQLGQITARSERDCASDWPQLRDQLAAVNLGWTGKPKAAVGRTVAIERQPECPTDRTNVLTPQGAVPQRESLIDAWRRRRAERTSVEVEAPVASTQAAPSTPAASSPPSNVPVLPSAPESGTDRMARWRQRFRSVTGSASSALACA